jgi:ribosomal protein S18 acetylase RimI-like enzyme
MEKLKMENIWLDKLSDVVCRKGSEAIDWADFKEFTIENGSFLVREVKNEKAELFKVSETFKNGFPALKGCEFDALFEPEGFYEFLGKDDNFNRGSNFMLVIEHLETGYLAAYLIVTMLKKLRRGEHLVIAVHQKYQDKGLGKQILTASDDLFERSGVEMAFGWCAAFHKATQKILLDLDTPRAVIPGMYRIWFGADEYKRTVEVFFQKFFNGAEEMCTSELDLIPEVKKALVVDWR